VIPAVPAPWPRPRYVPAGPASFAYVVLLPEAIELTKKDHPLFEHIRLETKIRSDDPEWFQGFIDPRSDHGSQLLRTPGIDIVGAQNAQAAMIISGVVEDPRDLGHLQRAFLLMKLLTGAGAVAACDVSSFVWWTRDQLEELPDDWEFDVADHIRVVFEAAEREPGAGHLCYTLGMVKFGRPDLAIGGLDREHASDAGEMLENLATVLAEGDNFETDDIVEPDNFPPLRCQEEEDDSGRENAIFQNRSLWLIPEVEGAEELPGEEESPEAEEPPEEKEPPAE
jgi:hypothetical protein